LNAIREEVLAALGEDNFTRVFELCVEHVNTRKHMKRLLNEEHLYVPNTSEVEPIIDAVNRGLLLPVDILLKSWPGIDCADLEDEYGSNLMNDISGEKAELQLIMDDADGTPTRIESLEINAKDAWDYRIVRRGDLPVGFVDESSYLKGLLEIASFIWTGRLAPLPVIGQLFEEARLSYAHGCYLAACCILRSILEFALRHAQAEKDTIGYQLEHPLQSYNEFGPLSESADPQICPHCGNAISTRETCGKWIDRIIADTRCAREAKDLWHGLSASCHGRETPDRPKTMVYFERIYKLIPRLLSPES
jgi:hypothetical protein